MLQALAELNDSLLKFEEAMTAQDLSAAAVHARAARRQVELVATEMQQTPLHAVVAARVDGCEQRLAEAARRCWSACWSVQATGKGERLGCSVELSPRVGQTSVPQLLDLLRGMGALASSLEQACAHACYPTASLPLRSLQVGAAPLWPRRCLFGAQS